MKTVHLENKKSRLFVNLFTGIPDILTKLNSRRIGYPGKQKGESRNMERNPRVFSRIPLARVDVDTGRISTPATDDYFHVYDTHPDTGIPLVGYQLPMVPEAIAMAKEAAQVFPQVGHVGWDMAVTPDGPAIIEGNNFPGTDLCQLAPLWPEKTGLWPYYKHILHLK